MGSSSYKKGHGKGSVKACGCETECTDHDTCDVTTMRPDPYIIIIGIYADGSRKELYRGGCLGFYTDFVVTTDPMPDCLEIEIRRKTGDYRDVAQVSQFDITCRPGTPLNIGDRFGGVHIVKINH